MHGKMVPDYSTTTTNPLQRRPGDSDLSRPPLRGADGPPLPRPPAGPFENAKSLDGCIRKEPCGHMAKFAKGSMAHVVMFFSKKVVPDVPFIAFSASSLFAYSTNA